MFLRKDALKVLFDNRHKVQEITKQADVKGLKSVTLFNNKALGLRCRFINKLRDHVHMTIKVSNSITYIYGCTHPYHCCLCAKVHHAPARADRLRLGSS